MESLSDSFGDELFWVYAFFVLFGLLVLWILSIVGRPVAHSDRKLGSMHKEVEAERVKILERLKSGSKLDDAQMKGGADLLLLRADTSDIEKEPLCSPLFPDSNKEANVATISLSASGVIRLPMQGYESMKKLSEEAIDDSFLCTSDRAMLQSKVELHDGMLERLQDMVTLVKDSRPQLKDVTPVQPPVLQVDNWAILQPSDQGVNLLRLPVDKVPVILHAEYAAGLLTITGLNLEDIDLYLSAEKANNTVKLNVWRLHKASKKKWYGIQPWQCFSDTEEDVATVPVRLSWTDMKVVFVYATKKVHLGGDGQSVHAVSKAVRVVDSFWNTVFDLWISTIAVWILTIYHIRALLILANPYLPGFKQIVDNVSIAFVPLLIIAMRKTRKIMVVEFFKYHVETLIGGLGQGLFVVYYGFKSLRGPGPEFPKYWRLQPPPPVPKVPSSTPPPKYPPPPKENGSRLSVEAASVQSVEDPDWQWPAFDEFEDNKFGRPTPRNRYEEVTDAVSPFRVIYIRKKGVLWPDVVRIDLFSTSLIKIVQKFFPNNDDLQCLENPKIQGRELFLALDGFKNHEVLARVADLLPAKSQAGKEVGKHEDKGELHLKHLVRFLDEEFIDVSVRLRQMSEEKLVAWDMLWTFLPPGKKVVYTCDHSQELLAAVVSKNSYVKNIGGEWLLSIDLEIWDYDGRSYHKCQISRKIRKFDGERGFSSLAVRPIEMEGVPKLLDEGFLANGKRFHELAMKTSHRFMHYSGPMFQLKVVNGCTVLVKENADGRVMIDVANFAKMKPGYEMASAKPPVASYYGPRDPVSGKRIREQTVEQLSPETTVDTQVSDETLIFAPAIVYGFSFTLQDWGSFAISGFSEISFDTNAFDALVMEPERKQLVYELVSQYIATPGGPSRSLQRADPISRKSKGCIFMCYGPSGTGKTLTAESLAENMHRPLWSLRASKLAIPSIALEQNLLEVMDIAETWGAVLLLDEADAFVEIRNSIPVPRNAMAGVFLRFLERHRGVLFLTTNRIGTFDNAFRSRVWFLHYPELSIQHKEEIWTTLLERAGIANATADFISQMAVQDLNGHEIRNVIHTAHVWADNKGETLRQEHVRHANSVLALLAPRTLSDTKVISEGKQSLSQ